MYRYRTVAVSGGFTAGSPILSTTPYRTVPYPTVFRYNFYHARGLLARGVPFFLPKILRFSAKKVKSANRTVFKIKTILAF
jgi:hypothetical protein